MWLSPVSLEADGGQLATTPEQRQPLQPIAQALRLCRPRPQAMGNRGVQGTSVRLPTVVVDTRESCQCRGRCRPASLQGVSVALVDMVDIAGACPVPSDCPTGAST